MALTAALDGFVDSDLATSAAARLRRWLEALSQKDEDGAYRRRLEEELAAIAAMGHSASIATAAAMVEAARDAGITLGPAMPRWSCSLVSAVLGLTDLDPLVEDLPFVSFIDPRHAHTSLRLSVGLARKRLPRFLKLLDRLLGRTPRITERTAHSVSLDLPETRLALMLRVDRESALLDAARTMSPTSPWPSGTPLSSRMPPPRAVHAALTTLGWLRGHEQHPIAQAAGESAHHLTAAIATYRADVGFEHRDAQHLARAIAGADLTATYPAPVLSACRGSFGVPIYGEQLMRIAHEFAGYSPLEANELRRYFHRTCRECREQPFVQQAQRRGRTRAAAAQVYGCIAELTSWPKSHADTCARAGVLCGLVAQRRLRDRRPHLRRRPMRTICSP